jgi:hypothetical protein
MKPLERAFFSVECRACGWKMGALSSGAIAEETLSRHAWICPKLRELQVVAAEEEQA